MALGARNVDHRPLYERDYHAWTARQARALRERCAEAVDWDLLAEEISDLGRSERRAVESELARLIAHLLKLKFEAASARRLHGRSWRLTVEDAREQVQQLFEDNPSLKAVLPDLFARAWRRGRRMALSESKVAEKAYPVQPLWTPERVLSDDFLP
jgi:uncharacterized protein DUF29